MGNGYLQSIFMPSFFKKILISVFLISALSFSIFLAINYNRGNLASLSSVITAWVTINPLEVEVSAPAEVEVNKVFQVRAEVINKGEDKIENAEAEIFLPPELILIKEDLIQEIGVIPGENEKRVRWSVKGEKPGNYFISVKASGELRGEGILAEDSIMVKLVKPQPRGRSLDWFQNLLDFFQERLRF